MTYHKKSSEYVSDTNSDVAVASTVAVTGFKPSAALLSLARSGRSGIRRRQVAILVGKGVEAATVKAIYTELLAEGAMPRFVGSRQGKIATADNGTLDVEVSLYDGASVLYDAVVIADGDLSVQQLAKDINTLNFIRQQYRHCTPFLAIGAGAQLLAKADVPLTLPSGLADPALLVESAYELKKALAAFKRTLAMH